MAAATDDGKRHMQQIWPGNVGRHDIVPQRCYLTQPPVTDTKTPVIWRLPLHAESFR